jgi:hypothetical protein
MKPIGLTFCLSVKISEGSPSHVMELQGDDQGVGDDQKMIINLLIGKEEREKQKCAQGKGITYRAILFWQSRHHRGCKCI